MIYVASAAIVAIAVVAWRMFAQIIDHASSSMEFWK